MCYIASMRHVNPSQPVFYILPPKLAPGGEVPGRENYYYIIRNRGRGLANLGLRKAEKKGKGEIISPFPKTMSIHKAVFYSVFYA